MYVGYHKPVLYSPAVMDESSLCGLVSKEEQQIYYTK